MVVKARGYLPNLWRHRYSQDGLFWPLCLTLFLIAATLADAFRGAVAAPSSTGTSTIHSFDAAGRQIGQWTSDENYVSANAGNTIQVGNTYYRYGDHQSCGYFTSPTNQYCGEAVYTTTDFSNKSWTFHGLLFDPAHYQSLCLSHGCFRPKMVYNATNNNYVLWLNTYEGPHDFEVWTCASPTGGATPSTPGACVHQPAPSAHGYDQNLFVDPTTNTAYLVTAHGTIYQLNSAYTDIAGPTGSINPSVLSEAFSMFYRNGTYYILYGPLCAYCWGLLRTTRYHPPRWGHIMGRRRLAPTLVAVRIATSPLRILLRGPCICMRAICGLATHPFKRVQSDITNLFRLAAKQSIR